MDEALASKANELARQAQSALAQGNLQLADILARNALDIQAAHPGATAVLAALVSALGLPTPYAQGMDGPPGRFLLIRAWGHGFWSDMFHVIGCLLLAEATGRTPVVHWGANSLFGRGDEQDAFSRYWRPVSGHSLRDIEGAGAVYPPKWEGANLAGEDQDQWRGPYARLGAVNFLNRPEAVAVCDFHIAVIDVLPWLPPTHPARGLSVDAACRYVIERYLWPADDLAQAAAAFAAHRFGGAPVVSVHARGTDKVGEQPLLAQVHAHHRSYLDRTPDHFKIFVLTDDAGLLGELRDRYGSRVVTTDSRRTIGEIGVHHLAGSDGEALGREVMVDTLAALHTDLFLGNGWSNLSLGVSLLKPWAPGTCFLTSPKRHLRRTPRLYGAAEDVGAA